MAVCYAHAPGLTGRVKVGVLTMARLRSCPRPGATIDPLDIVRWCEERMAYFMVPRFVEFRDALPKTPTQRVEKYKLQAEGHKQGTWDREKAGYRLSR